MKREPLVEDIQDYHGEFDATKVQIVTLGTSNEPTGKPTTFNLSLTMANACTVSAYQSCVSDRTSVRKAVLAMHETILPRRLSLAG